MIPHLDYGHFFLRIDRPPRASPPPCTWPWQDSLHSVAPRQYSPLYVTVRRETHTGTSPGRLPRGCPEKPHLFQKDRPPLLLFPESPLSKAGRPQWRGRDVAMKYLGAGVPTAHRPCASHPLLSALNALVRVSSVTHPNQHFLFPDRTSNPYPNPLYRKWKLILHNFVGAF